MGDHCEEQPEAPDTTIHPTHVIARNGPKGRDAAISGGRMAGPKHSRDCHVASLLAMTEQGGEPKRPT